MKPRRDEWAAVAALVAGVIIVSLVLCHTARAAGFEMHKPNYIITNYSSEHPDSTESPWLETQVSFRIPIMEAVNHEKLTVPFFPDGKPVLAFSLHAWWRIADESSPFDELDWNPEAYYSMFADKPVRLTSLAGSDVNLSGVRAGWEHVSTGVGGVNSRGWDRIVPEVKGQWKAVTLYLRPWWTFNYDQFTHEIADVVNIKGGDFGAEAIAKVETEDGALAVTVGNSYQDYELTVPLRQAWNLALFGKVHHGFNNSLVHFDQNATSGGAGILLKR